MPERPSLPSSPQQQERNDSAYGADTVKIQSIIERRWFPRPSSFVPKFIKRRYRAWLKSLPPEVKERWDLVSGIGQWVGLIVGGLLGLGFIISFLFHTTIFEPKDLKGIFNGAAPVTRVSYSIETVRTKEIDGAEVRQDTLVGISTDFKSRRFQSQANGINDATVRVVGDGKTAVIQRGQNTPGQLRRYPAEGSLRPLLGDDILKRANDVVRNDVTVRNERGWLVTWQPAREDIVRMMQTEFLALNGPDIAAIKAGRFTIDYATLTILRSTRQIYQINTTLNVNGAQLQILVTYRDYDPDLSNITYSDDQ